jgi:hypothetical protein
LEPDPSGALAPHNFCSKKQFAADACQLYANPS